MYPALCFVRPPFQLPFASTATVRQSLHVADFSCLARPQAQTLFDLQAGQRRWPLEGRNTC